jgi:hypothetical protein
MLDARGTEGAKVRGCEGAKGERNLRLQDEIGEGARVRKVPGCDRREEPASAPSSFNDDKHHVPVALAPSHPGTFAPFHTFLSPSHLRTLEPSHLRSQESPEGGCATPVPIQTI